MKCRAAVFSRPGQPLEIMPFDVPATPPPGAALCHVRLSTICGSDLHTIFGRRQEPVPLILGHEIVGQVVALGAGLEQDWCGNRLHVGDRVSWSIMASCGECFFCQCELPQKCVQLRKYGHTSCREPPYLTGGYAETICLLPGTAIFRLPASVPDAVAAPANCALSTVVNAVETIALRESETVLIQGAGMLGLNLIALCKEAKASRIVVTDVCRERLDMASAFGADATIDLSSGTDDDRLAALRDQAGDHGFDVAFEVCGVATAVPLALAALRVGGRYLVAGLVTPGSSLCLDGNQLTRRCLTIKGIHNYRPEHLATALRFLEDNWRRYPYDQLVGATFTLDDINQAVQAAASGKFIRVAIETQT
jgi:putative phosphonate catabolism associated alcohol dehydrogenase